MVARWCTASQGFGVAVGRVLLQFSLTQLQQHGTWILELWQSWGLSGLLFTLNWRTEGFSQKDVLLWIVVGKWRIKKMIFLLISISSSTSPTYWIPPWILLQLPSARLRKRMGWMGKDSSCEACLLCQASNNQQAKVLYPNFWQTWCYSEVVENSWKIKGRSMENHWSYMILLLSHSWLSCVITNHAEIVIVLWRV